MNSSNVTVIMTVNNHSLLRVNWQNSTRYMWVRRQSIVHKCIIWHGTCVDWVFPWETLFAKLQLKKYDNYTSHGKTSPSNWLLIVVVTRVALPTKYPASIQLQFPLRKKGLLNVFTKPIHKVQNILCCLIMMKCFPIIMDAKVQYPLGYSPHIMQLVHFDRNSMLTYLVPASFNYDVVSSNGKKGQLSPGNRYLSIEFTILLRMQTFSQQLYH